MGRRGGLQSQFCPSYLVHKPIKLKRMERRGGTANSIIILGNENPTKIWRRIQSRERVKWFNINTWRCVGEGRRVMGKRGWIHEIRETNVNLKHKQDETIFWFDYKGLLNQHLSCLSVITKKKTDNHWNHNDPRTNSSN